MIAIDVPDAEFIAELDRNVAKAELALAADVAKLPSADQNQKQRIRGTIRLKLKCLSILARVRRQWIASGYEH